MRSLLRFRRHKDKAEGKIQEVQRSPAGWHLPQARFPTTTSLETPSRKAQPTGKANVTEDHEIVENEAVLGSSAISNTSDAGGLELSRTTPVSIAEDVSRSLWNRAYESLKSGGDTSKLVTAYEKILTSVFQNESEASVVLLSDDAPNMFACDDDTRMTNMGEVTRIALARVRRHNTVNYAISQATEFTKIIQDAVGTMLSGYPPAALAWSGICVILPVLAGPAVQSIALKDGLFYVTEKLEWYLAISRLPFKESLSASGDLSHLRSLMESKVLQLIQSFLEFEMKSVCFLFAESPLVRTLKTMLSIDDWKSRTDSLKTLESEIRDSILQFQGASNSVSLIKINDNTSQITAVVKEMRLLRKQQTESQRLELVAKFCAENTCPYADRIDAVPKRVEGTCEWFQAHDRYRAWLESPDGGLLLFSADPGCGKSVLSRFLIEDILSLKMPDAVLCYFFFKDSPDQNNICAALCALIHQILSQYTELLDLVVNDIIKNGTGLTSKETTLWRIFEKITDRNKTKRDVVCVLDALDECQKADRITLVNRIKDLIEGNSNAARKRNESSRRKMRFLITTRGYPDIMNLFRHFPQGWIHLAGENKKEVDEIQSEITMVLDFKLNQLAREKMFDEMRKEKIRNSLMEKGGEQRTYLWVQLVFEVLEENLRDQLKIWNRLINTVPQTVYNAYDKLLERVRQDDKDRVIMLLSLMIVALRPLSVQTAAFLLGVRDFADSHDDPLHLQDSDNWEELDLESDANFKAWVSGTCGNFVTVYDEQLFFIHQTAKEFLLAAREAAGGGSSQSFKNCIAERQAHKLMAENCLLVWKYGRLRVEDESYRYCLDFTAHHFREAQSFSTDGEIVVQDIDNRFWDIYVASWDDGRFIQSQSLSRFLRNYDAEPFVTPYTDPMKLAFLATFGHYRLLDLMLRQSTTSGHILDAMDVPGLLSSTRAEAHCANLLLSYLPQRPVLVVQDYDSFI
ncbi:hypothetical protein BGW36DRAFT_429779 [Talaromyces proteolyticus]|uniref:NWD NACHT-NTPase N-terminal domain-containing protein n=1 Tax=Talaromyces proteolyticus TaxID=1131652 RepID=A0AAD4PY64_9EURO|nr:uncharacterized protein BGW36DRAFT_429779 [Talaromyces proteolyticus]KAH8693746.1 hypothetical protein BGW36DRAFT_429779 [Talaromyces proteolyticus]